MQRIKTEAANGRTYGECVVHELFNVQLVNGDFVPTVRVTNKPDPMCKEDAIIYYTEKLRRTWEELGIKS